MLPNNLSFNTTSSLSSVQLNKYSRPWLPRHHFNSIKGREHKAMNEIIKEKRYKAGLEATLRVIINNSTKGVTRISHETIAKERRVSRMTIIRHCAKLEEDGVIITSKNGWKQSNTTVIPAIQHLYFNKSNKKLHNLTSSDACNKHTHSEEKLEAICRTPDIEKIEMWEDKIEIDREEIAKAAKIAMRQCREFIIEVEQNNPLRFH